MQAQEERAKVLAGSKPEPSCCEVTTVPPLKETVKIKYKHRAQKYL